MLFVIHALDRPDALPTRLAHHPAHRAFLADKAAHGLEILMAGPLVTDDGATMIGSLFLVDAADRAAVERFNEADPFKAAGIWGEVTITAFIKR